MDEMTTSLLNKKIKIGKLDIHYLTGGQGDPLVIIHGGADGARAWLQSANELAKYYTVYVPNLPGFGGSKAISDEFAFSEYAAFVDNFSQNMNLKRFHLVGHSLGGGIALHYALQYPHKIQRLVLVSSICLGKEIALWARFLSQPTLYQPLVEAALSTVRIIRWLAKLVYAPFESIIPLSRFKMSIGKSIMTFKGQTTILLNQLSELLVPTLVVWGARDNIVPVAHGYAASRLIPDCQLHVFEDCTHSVYRQKIGEFSRILTKFLG